MNVIREQFPVFMLSARVSGFFLPAGEIPVYFVNPLPFQLRIETTMKTSAASQNRTLTPSQFQTKPRFDSEQPAPKKIRARASKPEFKQTEFQLEAPSAKSVKLAADFTNWEKFPLDMIRSEDGVWHAMIPLSLGNYFYRFIVDGQWSDDPRSTRSVPNPFGSLNAVKRVT